MAARGALRWVLAALALVVLAPAAGAATVTDSAGRKVELPATIARVLPAGPPAELLLYTLAPDKLIGWVAPLPAAARALLPARYAELPVVGRITSRAAPDPARIAALHPDLILDVGDVDAGYRALADREQQATGVPYLLIDGGLARSAAAYRTLGPILGAAARGETLAAAAQALIDAAAGRAGGRRVYYARGGGGLTTAGNASITTEFLAAIGAVNVAGDVVKAGMGNVTLDQVKAWAPDAVVAYDPAVAGAIAASPEWRAVPAVAAHHLYLAPDRPFSWLDEPPGVNRLIGLPWLAGELSIGAPPPDMRARARDFYQQFYGIALDDGGLDGLLAAVPN